jgi:hypothetical protein
MALDAMDRRVQQAFPADTPRNINKAWEIYERDYPKHLRYGRSHFYAKVYELHRLGFLVRADNGGYMQGYKDISIEGTLKAINPGALQEWEKPLYFYLHHWLFTDKTNQDRLNFIKAVEAYAAKLRVEDFMWYLTLLRHDPKKALELIDGQFTMKYSETDIRGIRDRIDRAEQAQREYEDEEDQDHS